MTSELRTRKFDRFFDLLDTDGNGFIEAQDWARTAEELSRGFNHPQGSAQETALRHTYGRVHQNICSAMDTDGDGRVSRTEFHDGLNRHVADPDLLDRTFRPAIDAEFDTADTDGDGVLDGTEIKRVWDVWGMSEADAKTAMEHMDTDGDGRISRDEYYATWREYLVSEDPAAPGSWMLGQL
ncbi:EF-hand domain-containing protein [Streptomyces sp. NBC_00237]|uniref:EF-hand domain-containing protein n=1 Tax=Streptomyces sp. NBC_00237 TaxID=2975687 RepID=UPI00225556B8|nr:EF-hand domain-containing protein [Streptomyces sp. NBC_00237]MCX5203191.1 EF-hand domain-containing protein [Streptomyces sp. NBC_00237]